MGSSSKKTTVGYKYYLGVHMPLCHGPIDKLARIRVDEDTAWEGTSEGGTIYINSPDLFGGESSEGGIQGYVDLEFGGPDQTENAYLQARQSTNIPAYRGVAAAVLKQVYMGTNPYLKDWEYRVQRVHTAENGDTQWYDDRSAIPTLVVDAPYSVSDIGSYDATYDLSSIGVTSFSDIYMRENGLDVYYLFAGTVYHLAMTTAWDLSTMYNTGESLSVGSISHRSVFFSRDGTRLYTHTRNRLYQFELESSWSLSGYTSSKNVSFGSQTYFASFSSDGKKIYRYDDDLELIVEYDTAQDWDISGITENGSSLSVTNTTKCFLVSNDGSMLYVAGDSLILAEYALSESYSIGTAVATGVTHSFENQPTGGIAFNNDGLKIYRFDIELEEIRQYPIQTGLYDMNPAHIIRECLTNSTWGMGLPSSEIDDTSFTAAADTLYDEEFGLSLQWDDDSSVQDFIQTIIEYIDAALYVDTSTGLFVLKLIRDDYDVNDLFVVDESNLIEIEEFKKPTLDDLSSYVTVTYYDLENSKEATVSVNDIALSQQQGIISNESYDYTGVTRESLATRLAYRQLKGVSTPLITAKLVVNRSAHVLSIGDAFVFSWPKFNINSVVMRITNIGYGLLDDGKIGIECAQDIFGIPDAIYSNGVDSEADDLNNQPQSATYQIAQELDYWSLIQSQGENFVIEPLDGYLMAAAGSPTDDSINFRAWTNESGAYVEQNSGDFCPVAILDEALTIIDSNGDILYTVAISNIDDIDVDLIDVGTICQVDDELMEVVSVSTSSLTVSRAVSDSAIADHSAGAAVYFWGDNLFAQIDTLYQATDAFNTKITPSTGLGQLAVSVAPPIAVEFDQRAYRPWLPGDLQFDGLYFPEMLSGAATVTATWAHRDRTLQTAGLDDYTEASIGPESGVTYDITVIRTDTEAVLDSYTGLSGATQVLNLSYNGEIKVSINSDRDGLASFYTQEHTMIVIGSEFMVSESDVYLVTETDDLIITE